MHLLLFSALVYIVASIINPLLLAVLDCV